MSPLRVPIVDPIERGKHSDAVQLANRKLRIGWFAKKPCEICGNLKVEMHHEDYNRPFYLRFLCRKHHALVSCGRLYLLPARPEDEALENMLSLQYEACKGRGPKILQGLPQRSRTQAQGSSEAIYTPG